MKGKKILKTLRGVRVVVTRARPQASEFVRLLRSQGAQVLACPTIKIMPPSSFRPLDRALRNLENYDWLIFTSVNGADKFAERNRKIRPGIPFPGNLKTMAIGPATADGIKSHGIPVHKTSKEYVAESILAAMPRVRGLKILIPRALEAREILPQELRKRGAKVDVIPVYKTVPDRSGLPRLKQWLGTGRADCVTFTSSSTVKNFFALVGPKVKREILSSRRIRAASIGPITTRTLREQGWNPKIIARKPTVPLLARAVIDFFRHSR